MMLFKLCILIILLNVPISISKNNQCDALVKGTIDFGSTNGTFKSGEKMLIRYQLKNISDIKIRGTVEGSLANLDNKVVQGFKQSVEILPQKTQSITFEARPDEAGLYRVYLRMRIGKENLCVNSTFMGYGFDKLQVPLTKKDDFDDFWDKTLLELEKIKPYYKITKKADLSTNYYTVYLVEMQSIQNHTIKGWYRVPNGKKNLPVVLQLPSLGGSFYNIRSLTEQPKHGVPYDFALFSLNIRGHGNSADEMDFSDDYKSYIRYGLESKENYIYRGAIMDCIRAIDFLETRSEIDKQKIVVEGASQGGALSLFTAALDKRIKLCAPDVPFLCDIDNLLKSAKWVSDEMNQFVLKNKNQSIWRVSQTLSYFDTKNFADKIDIPVLMSVGLQDWTCPASTCIATFNKISAEKVCLIYPEGKHEGGGAEHRRKKFEWIRKKLGI